ncbi:MAG: ADP-ribosylglycohydrolase family protein [Opitutaceae bacterium]
MNSAERYAGVLWGTAVGDSVGLPAEGMSREKIERLGWSDHWEHRFLFGKGMLSDDTEHSLMVAEALAKHPDDVVAFQRALAGKFRWWLLALPAGIGMATARSIIKLWCGFSPMNSGVFSAGNGPAMRSALIGAYFADQPEKMEVYVRASTELTHTDPKALVGALAVAYCAAWPDDLDRCWEALADLSQYESDEWPIIVGELKNALVAGKSVSDYAVQLGQASGISGYIYHTVPLVLFAWFKWHADEDGFEKGMIDVLNCGGDVDTIGAIYGAIAGAHWGRKRIPKEWSDGIQDWPRGAGYIDRCVSALAGAGDVPGFLWPFALIRNLFFLLVVLAHGFMRLVPSAFR